MLLILETERLRIRKINEQDTAFIIKLLNMPTWIEYIGDRNIRTEEDARLYIVNGPLFSYLKFGFGPYLVELKDSKESIGMNSLIKRDTLEDVDIGFAFLPEFNGKGYAFEASTALLKYATNELGIKKVVAIANATNVPSVKLLEKIGLSFEKTIRFPNEEEDLLFFST